MPTIKLKQNGAVIKIATPLRMNIGAIMQVILAEIFERQQMLLTLLSCRAIYFSACVLFARSQRYTAEKCRARLIGLLSYRAIYFPICDRPRPILWRFAPVTTQNLHTPSQLLRAASYQMLPYPYLGQM